MLLLDTQVVLWVSAGSPKLGRRSYALIEASSQVFVSSATVLELTIKSMLGKLDLPAGFIESLAEQGFQPLVIDHSDASGLENFAELVRNDPFDRLLLSQARAKGLDLVTADETILSLGLARVIDARR
jgi:PIN domain nuclease of toxin-antitoxin system